MLKMTSTLFLLALLGCTPTPQPNDGVTTSSGVQRVTADVQVNSRGRTTEQENIEARLKEDNKPGVVKFLYVVSPYSGQVIYADTVMGKVTSGGKRLIPKQAESYNDKSADLTSDQPDGFKFSVGGWQGTTLEVMGDDGTYGDSQPYIYWWDESGNYKSFFLTGAANVFVSATPIRFGQVVQTVENFEARAGERL